MTSITARQLSAPDWDRKGIVEPYLGKIQDLRKEGPIDRAALDQLLTALVHELRTTYTSQDVARALAGLERLVEEAEAASAMPPRRPHQDNSLVPMAAFATNAKAMATGAVHVARAAGRQAADALATARDRRQQQEAERFTRPLDGRALRKSVVPTWLMLVSLSWVSLLWGALISAPVGIGLGILASLFVGVIAVPLWGTVFGFLGMGAARSSTLAAMKFKPLGEDDPLHATTQTYSQQLGIPPPKLGSIDAFNAFAMGTGIRDATVAIGEPLRAQLSPAEVNAVLAHELGHVVSGDMRRMMLMRTFQNATVWFMLANGAKQFLRWIICWVAELAILGFSRKREYWADAIGAALAGKDAMIGALLKLDAAPALSAQENTHARFMVRGRARGLLSTHPSVAERVAALERETYLKRLPRQMQDNHDAR